MKQSTQKHLTIPEEEPQGCVVLICSHEPVFSRYYRELFASLGIVALTATTAYVALAIFRLVLVTFVIGDQENGKFESRRILQCARKDQKHAPVLVIAQNPDLDFHREAMALGAASYLDHSARPDEIVQALLGSLSRSLVGANH